MASTSKSNGIREILNRGTFLSLCLSLLVCSGVLVVWQWVSQVRANAYNVSLVRGALDRDAADLLTSSMLKNHDAVGFQLKTALASLPLKCAYIDLPGQRYSLKGNLKTCAQLSEDSDAVHHEEITSGGMTIGPLVYVLDAQALPPRSTIYLLFAFVGLVVCVVLTWGVLIKMINDSILRPIRALTASLSNGEYIPDARITCDEVASLADQLHHFRTQVATSAKREEFVRVARMVAHNIDTPVLVLEGVDASGLDDKSRSIYRSALSDIKDLIHNLRAQAGAMKQDESPKGLPDEIKSDLDASFGSTSSGSNSTALSNEHIMGLVEMSVSEMRLQNRTPYEIEFEPTMSSYRAFAKVQRTELKCMVLNLLNNAIESLWGADRDSGKILVGVAEADGIVRITVKDDGPGIDPALIPRLGERGFTVGKENGSGLGLHHAKSMAAAWGGNLRIESTLGEGALITVELPAASPPEWFVSEVRIPSGGKVVILDDDPNIGLIWRRRLIAAGLGSDGFVAFERTDDFKAWVHAQRDCDVIYLVDYELSAEEPNGIKAIEDLGIAERSILVTGRYDDPSVQAKVRWLGIQMIPKPLVGLVPVVIEAYSKRRQYVAEAEYENDQETWEIFR